MIAPAALETIAITGATGFVGTAALARAREAGLAVRALARRSQPAREGVTWIAGDLADEGALARLVDGADAVLHIAGATNAPDRAAFVAANADGTLALVRAARFAGVRRLVHVSSLAAREPGLSDYGWSKARAETIVAASGLDWTMVRPPAVYGPGDRDMLELFRAARRGLVPLPPRGHLSVIHVEDLARLLVALLPGGEDVTGEIFEADDARENGWTHKSFAKALGWSFDRRVAAVSLPRRVLALAARADRLARRERARLTPDRVAYFCHPDWRIDPRRRPPPARWLPAIRTPGGLKATARWYREQGWL